MRHTIHTPIRAALLPAHALLTADDLASYGERSNRTELVRGHLMVREPVGFRHGDIVVRLVVAISAHLAAEQARFRWTAPRGRLVAGDVGFTLTRNPDTVRAPDIAFITHDQALPANPDSFPEFAPALAIEVRSPSERAGNVLARVGDLLSAGTNTVWIIDAQRREARACRADGSESIISATDVLSGEQVLPDFAVRLDMLID